MPGRNRFLISFLMFWYLLGSTSVQGQILKDTASLNLLKKGVDHIYSFRFDDARDVAGKLNYAFPDHPVVHLLNGMIIYWENFPLIPLSSACISYETEMRESIRLCEIISEPPDYAEYLLSNLGARGMLLLYYADNNLSDKVFPLAKSTYSLIKQAFNYSSDYNDFYFFTGLYNYYREAYPDAHPVYKVVAFLFPKGDRKKGLSEMLTAANNSIMMKAESYSFLSHIYIHYENNYQQAYVYSKSLSELYPANPQYLALYIKNMLLAKKYDQAENIVRDSEKKNTNPFFRAQLSIFNGILQEKKYKNTTLAQKYYLKGINDLSGYGYYGNEYSAYAYFGLSRISDIDEDKRNKKTYRKNALELTNYKKVNFDD